MTPEETFIYNSIYEGLPDLYDILLLQIGTSGIDAIVEKFSSILHEALKCTRTGGFMNKPEFLTGKVLPFEEMLPLNILKNLILAFDSLHKRIGAVNPELFHAIAEGYIKNISQIISELNTIQDFYLQPLKPEIIEEYFDAITSQKTIFGKDWRKIPPPKTLAQFISNCNQAGIELEWKS